MDIYSIFTIFLSPETGLITAAVMSIMEFLIKPSVSRFSFRESNMFKKTILPIIVLILCILLSLMISPTIASTLGIKIIYGTGVGLICNFIYRTGLSTVSKKIGFEKAVKNSIFPDKMEK